MMKKQILFVLTALLTVGTAGAQENDGWRRWSVTPRVGLNMSDFAGSDKPDWVKAKAGYAFGVTTGDGFDGNVILKYTEGIVGAMMGMLKSYLSTSKVSKVGAALARPAFRKFKRSMDYNAYGGAPLLGVDGAVIKAHGTSGETAIMNALRQAREMLAGDVAGKIREGLEGLTE